jgi:hypothetical protein
MSDKKSLDVELAEYGRDELLHQSLDRAVRRGALRVEAVKDAMDLYQGKSVVDEKSLEITLNGLPLDQAIERIIQSRPLWQPTGDDPAVKARSELEAAALSGNVSAHGALWRELGDAGYERWKKAHAAQPGKVAAGDEATAAAAAKLLNGDASHSTNPFTKLRKADGTIDKAVEAKIGSMIAAMGHRAVTDIARAAKSPAAPLGLSLTGLPLKA